MVDSIPPMPPAGRRPPAPARWLPRLRLQKVAPVLVLAIGFALSFGVAGTFGDLSRAQVRAAFAQDAHRELGRIEDRLRAYVDTLHAVRGHVESMPYLDADSFRDFVQALRVSQRYPEMQGISWSRLVRREDILGFEAWLRLELATYAPRRLPVSVHPPGDRPDYLILQYAEPPTNAPFGLDLLAEPLRRPGIERARNSGTVTSVSGVALGPRAGESAHGQGMVMWLPVYEGRGTPATAGERYVQLRGTVGIVADVDLLVRSAIGADMLGRMRLRIEDTPTTDPAGVTRPGTLLFDSAPGIDGERARRVEPYSVARPVTIGERNWLATATPLAEPEDDLASINHGALLAAMLAASALAAWLVAALCSLRLRGEAMRRTGDTAQALIGFGEDLHASASRDETLDVLQRQLPRLLPSTAGSLYEHLADGRLHPAVSWGAWADDGSFAVSDCQALRRGHRYRSDGYGLTCEHVYPGAGPYLCLPMNAGGELIGLLHMRLPASEGAHDRMPDLLAMMAEGVVQQVTLALANLRLREKLQEQALRDHLTGLYNRHYAMEWLVQELHRAQRTHGTVGAVMIDIDHFKAVNDRYGHAAGDLVLQRIGDLLCGLTRRSDVACRYGGEEFLLLLRGAPPEAVRERAERVRREVEAMDLQWQGHAIGPVTVSAGVALFPDDAGDADALLQRVDQALYAAKHLGRNRVAQAESPHPAPGRPPDTLANGVPLP